VNFYRERVVNGALEVDRVYESDSVIAVRHTQPSYPVYIVVIPKEEVDDLRCLGQQSTLALELIEAIQTVAATVLEVHEGCRVVTNLGSYQDSKHLHWHVISGERLSDERREDK
jgi:histidine triad (HIT) family protein